MQYSRTLCRRRYKGVLNRSLRDCFGWFRFFSRITSYNVCYTKLLRLATLLAFVVVLVAVLFSIGKLDKTFFPDFNYNQCYIEHTLPKGTSPEAVAHNLKQITEHFQSYPEVDMVVTSLGMTPMRYCLVRGMMAENADNYGELIVNFKDYESMQRMRPVFQKYLREQFPEAISRIRKYSLSIKSTHSVEAEFTGPDPKVLKELSNQVQQLMLQNPHA